MFSTYLNVHTYVYIRSKKNIYSCESDKKVFQKWEKFRSSVLMGYYKFSELEAIKIPKFFKALNFPTTFKGGCSFSELKIQKALKIPNFG